MKNKEFKELKEYVQGVIDDYDEERLDDGLSELEWDYEEKGKALTRQKIEAIIEEYDLQHQLFLNTLIYQYQNYDYAEFDELTQNQQDIIDSLAETVELRGSDNDYGYIPLDYYSVFCNMIKKVSDGKFEGYEFVC